MRPPDRQQAAEHPAHPDEQPTGRCRLRARPRQPAAHARAQRLPQRCASAPSAMLSSNVGRQPVAIAPALLAQPPPLERELGRAPAYAAVCRRGEHGRNAIGRLGSPTTCMRASGGPELVPRLPSGFWPNVLPSNSSSQQVLLKAWYLSHMLAVHGRHACAEAGKG